MFVQQLDCYRLVFEAGNRYLAAAVAIMTGLLKIQASFCICLLLALEHALDDFSVCIFSCLFNVAG